MHRVPFDILPESQRGREIVARLADWLRFCFGLISRPRGMGERHGGTGIVQPPEPINPSNVSRVGGSYCSNGLVLPFLDIAVQVVPFTFGRNVKIDRGSLRHVPEHTVKNGGREEYVSHAFIMTTPREPHKSREKVRLELIALLLRRRNRSHRLLKTKLSLQ